ncbi:MAG: pentapeptide repeat-containing protein [Elainellaceae cyanobacterium]
MRERFKQWQSKIRINKWWVVGAIATPVFLGMVGWLWLLPDRRLQPNDGRLTHNERATLAHPHRETLISGIGTVAMVAGGVFLLINFRIANRNAETANLSDADLNGADLISANLCGADLCGAELNCANLSNANLCGANLCGADLNGAELRGANLSGANLNGADLISANLSGANLCGADLRYANLCGADLRYTNLSGADLRYANLSGADLNCALLSDANLSDAKLSGALLFFINSREVQNLEPLQLEAKPSPFLCNAALPSYSSQPDVNPNRDCDRIPQLLSTRYDISLEEAQGIVDEARQHQWD